MNVGISVPLPAYLVDVGFMASKVEELGFESFWCAEHPFIPVHSKSRFPGSADGVIPESYRHFIDPFVALARASGVTSRIKLGTGIVLVPERHPLVLAKEISTLDLFSSGRFLFGIGAGWLREETELMGGDFDHRWSLSGLDEFAEERGHRLWRRLIRWLAEPVQGEPLRVRPERWLSARGEPVRLLASLQDHEFRPVAGATVQGEAVDEQGRRQAVSFEPRE